MEQPAASLQAYIAGFPGRILLTAESTGRRESLRDQLRAFDIRPVPVDDWDDFIASQEALCVTVAPLEQGFVLDGNDMAVITETALFGEHARQTRRRKPASALSFSMPGSFLPRATPATRTMTTTPGTTKRTTAR